MKFLVDNELLFELSETQLKVLKENIVNAELKDDLKRRVVVAILGKYEKCFKRFKDKWEPKLQEAGVEMIPTDQEKFCKLVFEHPIYKEQNK